MIFKVVSVIFSFSFSFPLVLARTPKLEPLGRAMMHELQLSQELLLSRLTVLMIVTIIIICSN